MGAAGRRPVLCTGGRGRGPRSPSVSLARSLTRPRTHTHTQQQQRAGSGAGAGAGAGSPLLRLHAHARRRRRRRTSIQRVGSPWGAHSERAPGGMAGMAPGADCRRRRCWSPPVHLPALWARGFWGATHFWPLLRPRLTRPMLEPNKPAQHLGHGARRAMAVDRGGGGVGPHTHAWVPRTTYNTCCVFYRVSSLRRASCVCVCVVYVRCMCACACACTIRVRVCTCVRARVCTTVHC